MQTFNVPRELNEYSANLLTQNLWALDPTEEIEINIALLRFALPYGALLFANSLKSYIDFHNAKIKITNINRLSNVFGYLAHVGFFKLAYFDVGNAPGVASGSQSYIPIEVIEKRIFEEKAEEYLEDTGTSLPLAHFVNGYSYRLASLITNSGYSQYQNLISYCLREIIRNVFEHGETDNCTIFGQNYANGNVEIAIVDNGIGLLASLREEYHISSHEEALLHSITPGVSSKLNQGRGDEWANSGFGLFVLSELGNQFGQFSICSGTSSLAKRNNGLKLEPSQFKGTAVQLKINMHQLSNNDNIIEEICEQGMALASSQEQQIIASQSSYSFLQ